MRTQALLFSLIPTVCCTACSSSSDHDSAPAARGSATRVEVGLGERSGFQPAVDRGGSWRSGTLPAAATGGDYAGYPALARMIAKLERDEGFDPGYLSAVFSRVERQQWILDFVNRPQAKRSTTPTGAWTRYRAKFLTEANIANGARFWQRYAPVLERAQARYGVPPEYVVAILGVETRYGGYMGKHRVLDALTTLAFDFPRRSEFFTGELESFLIMARNEGFDPFQPKGSYAGAMGLGQFMPSSFQRWAVDFDGDGRRDLWNTEDAIGSVANYFAAHGWRKGEPVVVRARAAGSAAAMETGFDTSYSVDGLSQRGVVPSAALGGQTHVSLLRLDARGGYEYWLGLPNFYVITRYNHSTYYAMAVYQLAQAIKARHGPSTGAIISRRESASDGAAL